MTGDARRTTLDELSRRLESLISSFGGGALDSDAVHHAWTACARAFDAFRTAFEEGATRTVSPDLRARIEQVLKLEAVAAGLAGRERDEAARQLENLSSVRARLRGYASGAPTGESCDLTG